jgi:hypothetical protein
MLSSILEIDLVAVTCSIIVSDQWGPCLLQDNDSCFAKEGMNRMRKLLLLTLFLLIPLLVIPTNVQAQEETEGSDAVLNVGDLGTSQLFYQEEDTVDISTGRTNYLWFIDGYVGKERFFQNDTEVGQCAALIGFKGGVTPGLGDSAEFEAAIGGKINLEEGDDSSIFGDLAINGLFGAGFVGAGVSFWDSI